MPKLKLLLVDNDELIRDLIMEILGDDYGFSEFDNPEEALDAYKDQGPFDLVITDVEMGARYINGLELAKLIFEEKVTQPLIIMSGKDQMIEIADQSNIPTLKKPFDIDVLQKLVQETIAV